MPTSETTIPTDASVDEPTSSGSRRSRVGKVARLPLKIRSELNRRIDNGQLGRSLADWLNGLPEVQAVLKAEFAGRAVNEQNLTEWRQGGYRDWQRQQERLALVGKWGEEAEELSKSAGREGLSGTLSQVLLAEMAQGLEELLDGELSAEERLSQLKEMAERVAQLRRAESQAGLARVVAEKWEREKALEDARKERPSGAALDNNFRLQRLCLEQFSASAARG